MSNIELLTSERGKHWHVKEAFTVTNRDGKKLTVRKSFSHDRYTFAPDLDDERPAIVHDFAYDVEGAHRCWDDGTPISRSEADLFLYDLMKASPDEKTHKCALQYYTWVRRLGWPVWYWGSIKSLAS